MMLSTKIYAWSGCSGGASHRDGSLEQPKSSIVKSTVDPDLDLHCVQYLRANLLVECFSSNYVVFIDRKWMTCTE